MSIEIVEENNTVLQSCDFLPPAVEAARRSGKSAFGMITACVFILAALALCVCGLASGLAVALSAIILLITEIIGFVRAKNTVGSFGLSLRRTAYLLVAVFLLAVAVFSEFDLYHDYAGLLKPVYGFALEFPEPFCYLFRPEFLGESVVLASLSAGSLAMGLCYGSLNRARRKNLPAGKVHLFSCVLSLLAAAVLMCDGLARLFVIPSNYIYEDWSKGLIITRYCHAGISFAFALVLLLLAVRLLIIFIRMRKVRKCCSQNRNMNI